jgi:hypothetical protein
VVSSEWSVPTSDVALAPYVSRVKREMALLINNSVPSQKGCRHVGSWASDESKQPERPNIAVDVNGKRSVEGLTFGNRSVLFPKQTENAARAVFADFGIELCFFISGNEKTSAPDCDLHILADARDNVSLSFNVREAEITVEGQRMQVSTRDFNSNGKIVSLADLSSARVIVTMKDIPDASNDVLRIWKTEKINYVEMLIGGRRFFFVPSPVAGMEYPSYSCKLPPSIEYSADVNLKCQ